MYHDILTTLSLKTSKTENVQFHYCPQQNWGTDWTDQGPWISFEKKNKPMSQSTSVAVPDLNM